MCYKRIKVFTTQTHCLSEILSESMCNYFSYTFFGFYGLAATGRTGREGCNKIAVINTDQATRGIRSSFRPQEGTLLKKELRVHVSNYKNV